MERQFVYVCIEWFKKDVSPPEIPYEGIRFCPQIRFDDEGTGMPNWTAEVIIRNCKDTLCCAELRYLFEEAPHDFLKPGSIFTLFDGPNEIAKGRVERIK